MLRRPIQVQCVPNYVFFRIFNTPYLENKAFLKKYSYEEHYFYLKVLSHILGSDFKSDSPCIDGRFKMGWGTKGQNLAIEFQPSAVL